MTVSEASLVVAAVGVAVTLVWFVAIAYLNPATSDFFFANRSLDATRIRANLAATATSLAGALFFFLNATPLFGWLMLLVPLFNVAGIMLFLLLVRGEDPDPANTGSIFRFLLHRTGSGQIARHCNYVVVLNFVAVFVIEITIGSLIFSYFFNQNEALQTPLRLVGATLLSAIVLWYVWKGGFAAVSQTDKWQFALVASGFGLTFLFVSYSWMNADGTAQDIVDVFKHPEVDTNFQISFLINLVFINLFMPMTQISTWQRYSSGNKADVIKGFWQGIWQNILPLWYGVIAIAALVYLLSDQGTGFASLFDTLRTRNTLAAMFVFPLLFVGLVAALLSTADSMLIAIMLAINDARAGNGSYRQDESDDIEAIPSPSDREVLSTGVAVILIALLVGGLLSISEDLDTTVTQLLFASYGMPCLLFPIIAVDWIGAGITPNRLLNYHYLAGGSVPETNTMHRRRIGAVRGGWNPRARFGDAARHGWPR